MSRKVLVLFGMVALALLPVGAGGEENFVPLVEYPRNDSGVEWQRHACAICGKTIWERVEFTSISAVNGDMEVSWGVGPMALKDNGDGTYSIIDTPPARVEVEKLVYRAEYKVCPHCLGKYTEDFGQAIRDTAKGFIERAKVQESKRRATVARENTQEELRRVEAQLKECAAQIAKLTERVAELKGQAKP